MVWKTSKSGVFSMRSFFVALEGDVAFPSKIVWGSWAPTKILTLDQLKRRGWVLVGLCCMCKDADESVDHLLIHCGIAREL
ncbi:hypothetical protein AAG906_023982 [Vitis piasezkii]